VTEGLAVAARERLAYVTLALVPGVGHVRLRALLDEFGSATGALAAPFAHLCAVRGMSRAAAGAVIDARVGTAEQALLAADRLGGTVLIPGDAQFPSLLADIPDPPTVLFALGDLVLLTRAAVAVVGSRDPTGYGLDVCRRIVGLASAAGLVVVSGMARGLDAAAHEHALALRAGTIGVLGNGLGVVYPAANRQLYDRMAQRGLLLTEFPPGERPSAGSFPRRNRLISGLAAVTVVVEAAATSGALITANAAAEQGRDVLAVPGPITTPTSAGVNRLLRDGAFPYLEPDDLLRQYPGAARVAARFAGPGDGASIDDFPGLTGAGAELARVAALLGWDGVPIDALAAKAGLPLGEVLGHLAALEVVGFAEQLAGGRFRRVQGTGGGPAA
jgi:DNA processing protein